MQVLRVPGNKCTISEGKCKYTVVSPEETLWTIADMYKLRIEILYHLNIDPYTQKGPTIEVGQVCAKGGVLFVNQRLVDGEAVNACYFHDNTYSYLLSNAHRLSKCPAWTPSPEGVTTKWRQRRRMPQLQHYIRQMWTRCSG